MSSTVNTVKNKDKKAKNKRKQAVEDLRRRMLDPEYEITEADRAIQDNIGNDNDQNDNDIESKACVFCTNVYIRVYILVLR